MLRIPHFSNVVGWSADILVRLCVRGNPQADKKFPCRQDLSDLFQWQ